MTTLELDASIPDRPNAEAMLEELYEFFMQVPEPMLRLTGPEHVYVMSNIANNQLIGCDPLHRKVRDVFTETEAGNFFELLDQVYNTGVPFVGKEIGFKTQGRSGQLELKWLDVNYYPERDQNQKITGILGIAHDVTDQVIARKVIEGNEGRVQRYAEAMPQMAFMTDAQGEVTYFNARHYEYFGVDRIEQEGSRWKQQSIVHPDDLQMSIDAWSDSVRTGKTYQVQYRLRRRDGEFRWFLARGIPDKDVDGNIRAWYGTNTDIHEQKIIEQELSDEKRLRERVTSALAHDLRTPLSIASMASQLLLKQHLGNKEQSKLLHKIIESLDRVDGMIFDLLDASRIQAGHALFVSIEECDLHQVVEKTIEDLMLAHGNRIILRAQEEVKGYWNRDGLRRALENLVINSIKYGSPQAPVTVTLDQSDEQVRLAVHNYGRTLSQLEKSTFFNLFQRGGVVGVSGKQGWGIGLTVVKGIVESHGGEISVKSTESEGTTFILTLPKDVRPVLGQQRER